VKRHSLGMALAMAALLIPGSALAQDASGPNDNGGPSAAPAGTSAGTAQPADTSGGATQDVSGGSGVGLATKSGCEATIQYYRPTNQCGVGMFETPKTEPLKFTGFRIGWGAAFTQPVQDLTHSNTANPKVVNGVNANQLMNMGPGFNLASANLYLNAQVADGIRVQLTTYLATRHHNDTWVKDGFLQMDKSPINLGLLNVLWERYITVKVGHMEVNYGDQHFRRSDGGEGMYNPFVGNLVLDSYTTEIGGEVDVHAAHGILAVGEITGGEIKGNVLNPGARSPAFIGKLGIDQQVKPDLRVRLTGSVYTVKKSAGDTLYGGDRAGSPYFFAMENTQATADGNAFSGTLNPGFSYKLTTYQVNPFVKYRGLELFGVLEQATGRTAAETAERTWNQYAVDAVYRFADDKLFAGARYDVANGRLNGIANDVGIHRTQFAAGWYLNRYLLMKGEYIIQNYFDFPTTDIRNGGSFHGFVGHAVLAF
jgi:hypothetical protein